MIPYINIRFPSLGPLTIHMFGILVAVGILVGARLTRKRGEELGLEPERVAQMVTTILVCGFIFGHLFDVFAYQWKGHTPTLWEIINPFGGLSSYGGFIGSVAGLFYWCKKNHQPVMPYADSLGYGLAAGWTFGRLGCFTAHDHPGQFTNLWIGVKYPEGTRHDLGLEEAMLAFGMTVLFFILSSRKKQPLGLYVGLLTFFYGPIRFALDFLRVTDLPGADPRYLGLTPAQWLSTITTVVGAGLLAWTWRNAKKQPAAA
jgi:phosphatidylglycerol:prolipoprotein diacylglycerol transferase